MRLFNLLWLIWKDNSGGTLAVTRKTANTLITAAGFNTNYDEIEAVLNGGIDANNLEDDAVSAAKLNSDVVRTDYGLSQHTTGALQVDLSDTNPSLELTDGGLRAKVDGTTINRSSSGLVLIQGGVDHGSIAGLTDDDHAQYLNVARHDADDHSSFSFATMGAGTLPVTKGGTGKTKLVCGNTAYSAGEMTITFGGTNFANTDYQIFVNKIKAGSVPAAGFVIKSKTVSSFIIWNNSEAIDSYDWLVIGTSA
jgi:hypothetical protein